MRVLQVNNFHYPKGGSDRYFLELSNLLRDTGIIVKTFSTHHVRNIHSDLLCVPPIDGINTDSFQTGSGVFHYFYSRSARKAMSEAIKIFKPDVVHLHIYYGQLTSSILKPIIRAGVPIVQTLHEYKTVCATHGLFLNGKDCEVCHGRNHWMALLKKCNRGSFSRSLLSAAEMYSSRFLGSLRYVDRFIAVSEYQKERLVRLGMPAGKIDVVYHFSTSTRDSVQSGGKYLLYVGRLTKGKGIECLLKAISTLLPNVPPLHIVGEGDFMPYLRQLASSLGLNNYVQWRGFLSGADLTKAYEQALAIINPSELNETFGLTALEGLSVGRPIIASKAGALPEVVRDEIDGLLFSPGDFEALALCIKYIVENPSVAVDMGASGFNRAINFFSAQRHLDRILDVYAKVSDV